jgi:hypothetical protein
MPDTNKPANQTHSNTAANRPSSPGDSPARSSPKDVSPEDAAWKDQTEKKTASDQAEDHTEELLDEASELSFPASDPPAVASTTKLVKDKDGKVHPAEEESKTKH